MTPDEFSDMGRALYGPTWQSDVARALGVADRTVRRWLSARKPLPDGVEGEMTRLLAERSGEINRLLGDAA